jgi:hypothetical protein
MGGALCSPPGPPAPRVDTIEGPSDTALRPGVEAIRTSSLKRHELGAENSMRPCRP